MNLALLRLGMRHHRRHRLQTALLLLGVALGVALVVSIDIANTSAEASFRRSTASLSGTVTHEIRSTSATLPDSVYPFLRRHGAPGELAPVVEGIVTVDAIPLRVLGVDPFAMLGQALFAGDAGGLDGLSAFLTQPGAMLMSSETAQRLVARTGDTLLALRNGKHVPLILIAILQPSDEIVEQSLSGTMLCDVATAQELLGQHGRLSRIEATLDPQDVPLLRAMLPAMLTVETAGGRTRAMASMTDSFTLNLTALSLLALLVGVFLIYDTISFSVVQRREQFGVLRTLGVTRSELFQLVLLESAVLGAVGTALGLILGVVLGTGTVHLVTRTISDLYMTLSATESGVAPITLLKGGLLGMAASLFAAILPAREAMRSEAVSTMRRSEGEQRFVRMLPRVAGMGVVLILLGTGVLQLPGSRVDLAFLAVFSMLLGMTLCLPAILAFSVRLLRKGAARLGLFTLSMAALNIRASLSRASVAVAALTLAVAVIVGVNTMIGSFRVTVTQWLSSTLGADVYVSMPFRGAGFDDGLPRTIADEIRSEIGTARIATARTLTMMSTRYGALQLVAVSDDIAPDRPYKWRSAASTTMREDFQAGAVYVSEPFAWRHGIEAKEGQRLNVETPQGTRSFPIAAVYYDYSTDKGAVLLGDSLYRAVWGDSLLSSIAIFLEKGTDAAAYVNKLRQRLGPWGEVEVQSRQGLRGAAMDMFDRTFTVTFALQLLAAVVAFIGVLSSLLAQQLDRRREAGLLRSLGMTAAQLRRLLVVESAVLGAAAALYSLPVGMAMAWLLTHIINIRSFGWSLTLTIDAADLMQPMLVAIGAALLASILPALRFSALRITEAMRTE